VALRSQFPQYVEAVTRPVGRGLGRTGITPNVLTTLGLLLTALATYLVGSGALVLGAWVLVLGGLMDTFDGAVARATNRSTPFGSFYDSVSDRISDGVILGGLAWFLRDQPRLFVLAVVALVAAEVTSYVRAKAEAIDLECSVGILERAERAILLMIGLLFHRWLLEPVLWLLAIGGSVTVVQRVHHVWCQIDRDIPAELLELAAQDRAWSRAFKAAARRFYGERNFDPALDEHEATRRNGTPSPTGAPVPVDGHGAARNDGFRASPAADASGVVLPVDEAQTTLPLDGTDTTAIDGRGSPT
jgi:CDP-diacylglycerol---glycerol-3-phosphate 3-phosphatidyltransferase